MQPICDAASGDTGASLKNSRELTLVANVILNMDEFLTKG